MRAFIILDKGLLGPGSVRPDTRVRASGDMAAEGAPLAITHARLAGSSLWQSFRVSMISSFVGFGKLPGREQKARRAMVIAG